MYVLSLIDRYNRPDLTLDEAKILMRKCVDEVKSRFAINLIDFKVKIAVKDGVHELTQKDKIKEDFCRSYNSR